MTVTFAAAMALLLSGLGLFIYLRLQSQLNAAVDQGLRSRADDVAALVRESDSGLTRSGNLLAERGEAFAQIVTADGGVFDTTAGLGGGVVLDRMAIDRALRGPVLIERSELNGLEGTARLLASPVEAQGQQLVVVVGASLEERDGALADLAILLLIGGPSALILASLAGYAAVAAALRPVELMRKRANAITALGPEERLPLGSADDEVHRLGETLNRMLDRLAIALERERQFVDDASHELRTPLALHKTELELALRYGERPEELKASIGSAIEEVDRLIQLAEGMLVVARSEKGELALDPEPVRVASLLEDVAVRFSARAAEGGRELLVESGDAADSKIEVDRMRVDQALTNMVDNALRHGAGRVRLSASIVDQHVQLHVIDQGAGFPRRFLGEAFERFTRADESRHRRGSGLGLAIVAAIARAHGGTAGANHHDGGGADVWIAVPATPRSSA